MNTGMGIILSQEETGTEPPDFQSEFAGNLVKYTQMNIPRIICLRNGNGYMTTDTLKKNSHGCI